MLVILSGFFIGRLFAVDCSWLWWLPC